MTAPWGTNSSFIGGWALEGALVWRILLPAETAAGRLSWAQVAKMHNNPGPEDGYITWPEITAWPGSGPPGPADCDQPTYPDENTARALQNCLDAAVANTPWTSGSATTSLTNIINNWCLHRDLGRWRSGNIGFAAPAFADSALISGPATIGALLADHELEAWPVAPHLVLPPMTS